MQQHLGNWVAASLAWLLLAAGAIGPGQAGEAVRPADARALLTGEMRNFTLSDAPKPVAPVAFQDADGGDLSLEAFRGKVVLVNLWATWCVPCRHEMPGLDRLQAELGGTDFQVVALSQDRAGIDKVRAFFDEIALKHLDLYIDTRMRSARALGAPGLPATLLLDRDGKEVGRLIGAAEWDSPEAVRLIRHFIGDSAHERIQKANHAR